ncbi:MAG: TonB-dependent receptor [Undibacterium sp.]|nr:TonB-dependent receptor [Opitutaceae bacterium]
MITLTPLARRSLAAALLLICALGASAATDAKKSYRLPASDAATALRLFSDQSGEQIVYPVDSVRGVQTNAVTGEFSAREALDRLVVGTELRIVRDENSGALAVSRAAATIGSGTIEGRVFDIAGGSYVGKARVSIPALGLVTLTDEYGQYRFLRVPGGDVPVRVTYIGFPPETQVVQVTAGATATQDFTLRAARDASGDKAVTLSAFTVAAEREMAASDVAVNEQRYASGIKNIVSTDSFGDIADGNVGEFAKYLPGVTLNRNGSDGLNISIGGVPPSGTPIMLDGMGIASAASSNASRTVEFENIAVGSMSRVEVSRSQNPDMPANAIGGSVNLISKSAFERSKPQYIIRSYLSFRGDDLSFIKQPGPFAEKNYVFEPNLELSAVVPVTRNFGFTASGLVSRTRNNGPGVTMDWVPTIAAQSANFPATTPDKPYLARFRLQERPKITVRDSLSLSADWRVSPADVLTFGFQYSYFYSEFWVRQLNFDVGRVASFGSDFTQGVAGTGFAQIITDAREKTGTSYAPSLRYKHKGPVWEWQAGGAYSSASNHYSNKGYFQGNNAFLRNLTVRFDQVTADHPEVISIKDSAGVADVNPYKLANYKLESVSGLASESSATVRTLFFNAKRDFDFRVPIVAKAGVDFRSENRDMVRPTFATSFVGADGLARSADDSADQWYDPTYSQRELLFGKRMEWFDLSKIGDTARAHPEYFTNTDAEAVTSYRSRVNTSQAITETIAAPYLRLDTKIGRLQLTGGVRYERTEDDGNGPLIDPTRTYQRNASGQIVRDAAGRPVVIAALATLAGTKLAYVERGSSTQKTYDGFFPSLNGSYTVAPNLIARASFGRSINRPDFGNILPSLNLPDTEGTARTITATNPDLKPWTADSYGIALEYYFPEPATGVVSARAYRRDIKDFWGTTLTPATADVLEPYGIDPAIYGDALGYQVSTRRNVGSARVSGVELDYRQNLTFLPQWARGLTVFGNLTLQHLVGSDQASFDGFVGKTVNWGVTYARQRFTVRLAVNLRGLVKQGQVNNAGTEPGTFTYLMPRNSADFSAEYRLTRRVSAYVSGRNVNNAVDDTVTYGPSTPRDRIIRGRVHYGSTWYVGVKGTF